ncbi:uncharacterized protein [Watersipora subatra]|uniref:uncharacterized protein n=1 Tax=Watersipora subatra TaxID=2589382 RepID=UPI00355BE609
MTSICSVSYVAIAATSLTLSSSDESLHEDVRDTAGELRLPQGSSLEESLKNCGSEIHLVGLNQDEVKKLCTLLKSKMKTTAIKLTDCNLAGVVELLSAATEMNESLEELLLADCKLTSNDVQHLVAMVSKHAPTLRIFSLRDNEDLRDAAVASIVTEFSTRAEKAFLNSNLHRQAKELATTSIKDAVRSDSLASIATEGSDDTEVAPMQTQLKQLALKTLDLSNCGVGNATCEKVRKLMLYGEDVEELKLSQNKDITMYAWKDLLSTITKPQCHLKCLDISSNPIGGTWLATGSPLQSLAGLKLDHLDLSGCQLSDSYAKPLAQELSKKGRTCIGNLKLEPGNNLSPESINDLVDSCRPKH